MHRAFALGVVACCSGCFQARAQQPARAPQAVTHLSCGIRDTNPAVRDLSLRCLTSCERGAKRGSDRFLLCIQACPAYEVRMGQCTSEDWLVCVDRTEGAEETSGLEWTVATIVAAPFVVAGLLGLWWLSDQGDDPNDGR